MKKIIKIEGMHCEKCSGRVEKTLNAIGGVSAKVSLAKKIAVVSITGSVTDEALKDAVEKLGFSVVEIADKKGIFG